MVDNDMDYFTAPRRGKIQAVTDAMNFMIEAENEKTPTL